MPVKTLNVMETPVCLVLLFAIHIAHVHANLKDIKGNTKTSLESVKTACKGSQPTYRFDENDLSKTAPPDYLSDYMNPCWVECLTTSQPYNMHSSFYAIHRTKDKFQTYHQHTVEKTKEMLNNMSKVWEERLNKHQPWRVRCLPGVYILGAEKSGTTDIYAWLRHHPFVMGSTRKEPRWWSVYRFPQYITDFARAPLQDYIDQFDQAADLARTNTKRRYGRTVHPVVIVDGTADTLWGMKGWSRAQENKGSLIPKNTTAQLIRHLTPHAKFIVALRNPAEQVYSSYKFFFSGKLSAKDFHKRVVIGMRDVQSCLSDYTYRTMYKCFRLSEEYMYDNDRSRMVALLMHAMYYVHLKTWLDVFPREQFFITRTEDYSARRKQTLPEMIKFLGLDKFSPYSFPDITLDQKMNHNAEKAESCGPMLPETKKILHRFYSPFNKKLVYLLNNEAYLWDDLL